MFIQCDTLFTNSNQFIQASPHKTDPIKLNTKFTKPQENYKEPKYSD